MAKMIPAAERIKKAHALIQKARDLPVPEDGGDFGGAYGGKFNLAYRAKVRELLQQARDLVKFIPYTPTATPEMKAEVAQIFAEADQANKDLLR
jgi:cytosine/adenosine deaminase-related metal-dependent hydrolase